MRLSKELIKKKKYRELGEEALLGNAESAILLFCLECMGGDEKCARTCTSKDCPLFRAAAKLWAERRGDAV